MSIRRLVFPLLVSASLAAGGVASGQPGGGGIPLRAVRAGHCSAIAPPDWQATYSDPKGSMIELGNGTFGAFYFIMGVDAMSMQGVPGLGHPAMLVQSTVAAGFRGEPVQHVSQPVSLGDLLVQEFDSAQFHAVALYRVYPMPMGGYVVLMRIASGPRQLWPAYGAVAVSVATSTHCVAQVTPVPEPGGTTTGGQSSESTYNMQLGTEYAHDPQTGELYLMQHSTDWWESGPDGPGYYKALPGGGYTRLTQGFGQ